jgi:L-alanine-DL-glutamate epimerase-like enolase superfamily enzyme
MEDGLAVPNERPGLGIDIDDAVLERYRVEET